MKAVEKRLSTGDDVRYAVHDMEWQLAEEICNRFPVEMLRFGSSGTESTMHAIRLARRRLGAIRSLSLKAVITGCTMPRW